MGKLFWYFSLGHVRGALLYRVRADINRFLL